MEVLVPYKAKAAKRIKLEHSYATHMTEFEFAEVKEEDPLKIYPEDLGSIKTEADEEITVIKTEPDTTAGGGYSHISECLNVENINELKDNSAVLVNSEPATKDRDAKFHCNDGLGLVNCEIEVANNTELLTLVDKCNDTVPRHVFLELQGMYERTMAELKALNRSKIENENTSVSKKGRARSPRKLTSEIKKLKEQLAASKHNAELLKKVIESRAYEKTELERANVKLEKQVQSLDQIVQDLKRESTTKEGLVKNLKMSLKRQTLSFNEKRQEMESTVSDLQKRLAIETQHKECELKCSLLTQKLNSATLTLSKQGVELRKLKLDMDIMDKSIIDSLKTNRLFNEQSSRLEKEMENLKDDPVLTLKLQEVQKQVKDANSCVEQLQKVVATERKLTQSLVKDKTALLEEQKRKSSEADKRLLSLNQKITSLRTSLSQKMLQCRFLQDEATSLQAEVRQKEKDLEEKEIQLKTKEEEYRTKVCEYCGF